VIWFAVVLGGIVGAPSRYVVDRAVSRRTTSPFPWGTLAINVAGSLALGALVSLAVHGRIAGTAFAGLGTGFCGAFTTFSTFTWETVALAEDGYAVRAAANLVLSLGFGLGAAALGYVLVT
jgi:fluoride exporter